MHETQHRILFHPAQEMSRLDNDSVSLIVTSPPYPMIEMWDESFTAQNGEIGSAISKGEGTAAFDLMHEILDEVWREAYRVLIPGGFACINIGDATRTIGEGFRLYSNHSRITSACTELGFEAIPLILWRKQTNGPTKFMGSGMLPAGAYVTLEHEYILIFRKGGKRKFTEEEKSRRRESAFFWEERNQWFSDLWELKGVRQSMENSPDFASASSGTHAPADGLLGSEDLTSLRKRSGAFPFEIPYRLISMYSLRGDTVLDPFLGTGTSVAAAAAAGRNSIGFEYDKTLAPGIRSMLLGSREIMNDRIRQRFEDHLTFVETYSKNKGKEPGHYHDYYRFPIMTRQEKELRIPFIEEILLDDPGNKKPEEGLMETRLKARSRDSADFAGPGTNNRKNGEKTYDSNGKNLPLFRGDESGR